MDEVKAQLTEIKSQMQAAEADLQAIVAGAERVRKEYVQLISWAELYDNCPFEAKKMIAGQLIKAVRVKRNYELDIEFNVSFAEFQEIYLEPETEWEKGAGTDTVLAMTEKTGQAEKTA